MQSRCTGSGCRSHGAGRLRFGYVGEQGQLANSEDRS